MSAGSDNITIRTYGRRKGHSLSPRKQRLVDDVLPGLRLDLGAQPPASLTSLFDPPVSQVWLEIGFGGGEHLAWQSEANPDVGFVGCEPFINGVSKLLSEIEERNLENVRIWDGDARDVLEWLPDNSLDRVFVLFPDPWPKARHHKRRLISTGTLEALARVMKPGSELRIASDIGDYVRASLEAVYSCKAFEWCAERPADWRSRPADWPPTRYEKKTIREGRKGYFLIFKRI
jgi:tRNA (guanine-N7-)-methyltransferase